MQGSRLPQEDAVQLHDDHGPLVQNGVQQVAYDPARMADLLAKVPSLALLAAGFFATIPIESPDSMGGTKH